MASFHYDVRDFGATGVARPGAPLVLEQFSYSWLRWPEGLTAVVYEAPAGAQLDSVGIQKALDAAHNAGGGTVVVPAGNYLIAPLRLRSRVRLHLEPGAFLWGSPNLEDYESEDPPRNSLTNALNRDVRGLDRYQRLINATDAEDVAITGFGQISAQSPRWIIPWLNSRPTEWIRERPTDTILFYRCRNIRVEGIRIVDTPSWTLVFDRCEHIQVRGVRIRSMDVINSDGIDLVDSSHATIADCNIHCTDDAICLKSIDPDYALRNITVTNCVIRTLCNGLKMGTDSAGAFQDIAFSNIVIHNPVEDLPYAEGGINLCAIDGGKVQNVGFTNIMMRNVKCPFYLLATCRQKQQQRYRTPRPGLIERVTISGLQADESTHPCFIVADPNEPIRNLLLQNIDIRKTRGAYEHVPRPRPTPDSYPTPFMFGSRQGDELPAFGLFQRHTRNVRLEGVRIESIPPDARPCLVSEAATSATDSER